MTERGNTARLVPGAEGVLSEETALTIPSDGASSLPRPRNGDTARLLDGVEMARPADFEHSSPATRVVPATRGEAPTAASPDGGRAGGAYEERQQDYKKDPFRYAVRTVPPNLHKELVEGYVRHVVNGEPLEGGEAAEAEAELAAPRPENRRRSRTPLWIGLGAATFAALSLAVFSQRVAGADEETRTMLQPESSGSAVPTSEAAAPASASQNSTASPSNTAFANASASMASLEAAKHSMVPEAPVAATTPAKTHVQPTLPAGGPTSRKKAPKRPSAPVKASIPSPAPSPRLVVDEERSNKPVVPESMPFQPE